MHFAVRHRCGSPVIRLAQAGHLLQSGLTECGQVATFIELEIHGAPIEREVPRKLRQPFVRSQQGLLVLMKVDQIKIVVSCCRRVAAGRTVHRQKCRSNLRRLHLCSRVQTSYEMDLPHNHPCRRRRVDWRPSSGSFCWAPAIQPVAVLFPVGDALHIRSIRRGSKTFAHLIRLRALRKMPANRSLETRTEVTGFGISVTRPGQPPSALTVQTSGVPVGRRSPPAVYRPAKTPRSPAANARQARDKCGKFVI